MHAHLGSGGRTPAETRHPTTASRPPSAAAVRPEAAAPAVATIAVDLDGDVISWNARAEQLFGWTEAEVIGRRLPILPADRWRDFQAILDAAARDLPIPSHVAQRQCRDGREIEVSLSAAPIRDARGRVSGILEVLSVPAEDRPGPTSIGTQRMEAVGRLAGGVAHDFNNILTAIAGYAGLLAGDLPADDPRQADVAEIRKATERATRLTRQLLAFGRREPQQPRLLDLREVVTDVVPMLRQLIGEHIDLVTNESVGLPAIFADPSQLEQVVLNLVLNARDAMPDGGRLIVSTSPTVLDEAFVALRPGSRTGRHVRLIVEDTGLGMPPDVLDHIFEPYFTTKTGGRGTGLGLSTVYGIVKQSGGYITADSSPGRGTTVSVYLPAA
jgi:PAS domain S-box-containing protein